MDHHLQLGPGAREVTAPQTNITAQLQHDLSPASKLRLSVLHYDAEPSVTAEFSRQLGDAIYQRQFYRAEVFPINRVLLPIELSQEDLLFNPPTPPPPGACTCYT